MDITHRLMDAFLHKQGWFPFAMIGIIVVFVVLGIWKKRRDDENRFARLRDHIKYNDYKEGK